MQKAIAEVLETQNFIYGPAVERFEKEFASYIGVRHCVALHSGTAALWLMLWASGVGPGDEVITTPLTFFATVEGILLCGAKPVFVDVDPRTLNMDASSVERALSPRSKALLPVHLYGQPADMEALRAVAERRGLILFEDAAQAAGSLYRGLKAGSLSRAASFSFYPGKNLGAYGDAGAVLTDDAELAARVRRLSNHGSERKNYHERLGFNVRPSSIQAAVLSVKLRYLEQWNERRRALAESYRRLLGGLPGLSWIEESAHSRSNYHLFVVRHSRRDALLEHLRGQGIEADIHYPVAAHLQPACGSARLPAGSLPHAEKAVGEILSLPLFPEMTQIQLEKVGRAVAGFCRRA
ncbi:MAG: DegT/DnrJ/EryC1/StrS family aminotransferase [Elusimicrobia bacterium]|nr:DegT/DnrJ/EryC1/StrS family aminotransferase [Elusimicrobiota bacterium]